MGQLVWLAKYVNDEIYVNMLAWEAYQINNERKNQMQAPASGLSKEYYILILYIRPETPVILLLTATGI